MTRYETLANTISTQIEQGTYAPGEKLPGVRKLGSIYSVSISTVIQANRLLEDRGLIEARPKSGYYIRIQTWQPPQQPRMTNPAPRPKKITGQELTMRLSQAAGQPGITKLGAAIPNAEFLPTHAINRALANAARQNSLRSAAYEFPPGSPELRKQIARRMSYAGCQVSPDEVVITSGCQEALLLCLRTVAKPGDVIAVESPTFYGLLQVIESLGLKALEIPTDPETGISLDALKLAIEQWPIKACVIVSNFNNPMGYCMSDNNKKKLLTLLNRHDVPLIEDDIYGDLSFDQNRPNAVKHFDKKGNVLYCSSFSKTISPGLRVGWVIPGKYQNQIEYQKYVTSLATPSLPQLAIAEFLERGGYDKHLRKVRNRYAQLVMQFTQCIGKYFPEQTRITQPKGGFVIWIELPEKVDAIKLYHDAFEHKISISPGPLFSATQKYKNHIRINCAQPWNAELEASLILLGRLAGSQATS